MVLNFVRCVSNSAFAICINCHHFGHVSLCLKQFKLDFLFVWKFIWFIAFHWLSFSLFPLMVDRYYCSDPIIDESTQREEGCSESYPYVEGAWIMFYWVMVVNDTYCKSITLEFRFFSIFITQYLKTLILFISIKESACLAMSFIFGGLSLTNPCCYGNEIWDKIKYNSDCIRDIFKIFASDGGFLETGCWMRPI